MHHRRQRLYDAQQRERALARARSAGRERCDGRRHGSRRHRPRGRGRARPARLSSRRLEPDAEVDPGRGDLPRRSRPRTRFLARTEILVCLLPQTPRTEGLLNLGLFRKLKRDGAAGGAFLINAARGRLQVDADIVAALDEGTLAGARSMSFRRSHCRREARCGAIPRSRSRRTTPATSRRACLPRASSPRSSGSSVVCRSKTPSIAYAAIDWSRL